jgi:thiamine biosynthesis lipoprotein
MHLKNYNYLIALAVITCLVPLSCRKTGEALIIEQGVTQGTTYTLKYETPPKPRSLQPVFQLLLDSIDQSMSTYLPGSAISRINKGDETVRIDPHFEKVYEKAREVWEKTDGRFDPTVGELVNAWGFGNSASLKNLSPQQVDSLLQFTGFEKISLSADGHLKKQNPSVWLDFNALAQGYTVDLLSGELSRQGIENYLVEIGGEVFAKGTNPTTGKDWVVGIDNPLQAPGKRTFAAKVKLKNSALATSGSYRKVKVDERTGRRYTHIINPKTGYPVENNVLSVSVIAPTCMEADAYATAFMLTPLTDFENLLAKLQNMEVYAIYTGEQGELKTYITKGFAALLVK